MIRLAIATSCSRRKARASTSTRRASCISPGPRSTTRRPWFFRGSSSKTLRRRRAVAAGTPLPSADGSPPPVSDPFETLGLAPVFELDPATLERRHRELSRALHPDRYAGRPTSERQQALGRAIEVNEAFRTLRNPVRRAEALLARSGRPVSESGGTPADPALLMAVMERREALGEARRGKDL